MKQKLKKLKEVAHEIIDADDKNTSLLLLTAHKRVEARANIYGTPAKIALMLYSAAKNYEDLAGIVVSVANALQKHDE
jgi:hypothetical protein